MTTLAKDPSHAELAALYRQHVAAVRMRGRQFIARPDVVEDIVQDVFLAFVKLARREEIRDVTEVLYHITTYAALKRLRSMHREIERTGGVDALALLDDRVAVLEDRVMLKTLISSVKERLALIAVYYYVEGMTQEEIAALTQLSQREVSRQLAAFAKRAEKLARPDDRGIKSAVRPTGAT
jgi:RNA polymerase sigma factor (sigma-70 family)